MMPQTVHANRHHLISYPRFIIKALGYATDGNWRFYSWMTLLTILFLLGINAYARQVADGMIRTNMSDHVSWGLYIANFTFMVGVAAGAVMMVIPAYLYNDKDMHEIVIVGELLAIAAISMCLFFVVVDLGRPDRFWHMLPGIGRFNWPISMLTWDVIVLNGYLLLNLHICGYQLYQRYLGNKPDPKWYVPFIFVSIVWAISIHTVTAFLYCGLGGRPFWNTALLVPRFLASAFVSGPVFLIIALRIVNRMSSFKIGENPVRTLIGIVRVAIIANLIMLVSEVFTEFYTGTAHASSAHYLYLGLHGHNALVPWIWTSIGLTIFAALAFMCPKIHSNRWLLDLACIAAFIGLWIEKGMGMIIPAFVPSTLHEIVEYTPSLTEWKVTFGIWALGLMIYTISLKIAIPIFKAAGEKKAG